MDLWPAIFAIAIFVTMWFVRKADAATTLVSWSWKLSLSEGLLVLAILGIVAAIAVPNFQDYQIRAQIAATEHVLGNARTTVGEWRGATANAEARQHLGSAEAHLNRAYGVTQTFGAQILTSQQFATFSSSLSSATDQLELAAIADPALAQQGGYHEIGDKLDQIQRKVSYPPTKARDDGWLHALLILGALFLAAVISAVIFVAVRYSGEKPATVKKWIRVYLEPVMSTFAIGIGLLLALYPGLDHSTSLWGAGIAGGGIGFWVKPT